MSGPAGSALKRFADDAGVRIVLCGAGWGGRYGYTTLDAPSCMTAGFKTKTDARRQWASDTFGERAGSALLNLLGAA